LVDFEQPDVVTITVGPSGLARRTRQRNELAPRRVVRSRIARCDHREQCAGIPGRQRGLGRRVDPGRDVARAMGERDVCQNPTGRGDPSRPQRVIVAEQRQETPLFRDESSDDLAGGNQRRTAAGLLPIDGRPTDRGDHARERLRVDVPGLEHDDEPTQR
jgi:hypothetical protein